jgi:hypothetical protein
LFVRDGRRNYRRRFSLTEVRLGLGILVLLALVGSWVAWRGANPDPALFEIPLELLQGGAAAADRGPLPDGLARDGWREDRLSSFESDNLYEKINGREDYYKSFGFERLWFLSILEAALDDDRDDASPPRTVDIELFDLGAAPNALGAYAGERPPDVLPTVDDNGMYHTSGNALFMTRGRYYVRVIGSDAGREVQELLAHLADRFRAHMSGEPLPWGYALFVGALQLDPGRVSFMPENAFSFGFARNVYAARIGDGETEVFVVASTADDSAIVVADRFTGGFLGYGSRAGAGSRGAGAPQWIEDRYLHRISGAVARGRWVLGVRGAPDIQSAEEELRPLSDAVGALPDTVVRQAAAAATLAPNTRSADESGAEYKEETSQTLESDPVTPEN